MDIRQRQICREAAKRQRRVCPENSFLIGGLKRIFLEKFKIIPCISAAVILKYKVKGGNALCRLMKFWKNKGNILVRA